MFLHKAKVNFLYHLFFYLTSIKGSLCASPCNIYAKQYANILRDKLHTTALKSEFRDSYYFKHDNDTKGMANKSRLWLLNNAKFVLKDSLQSMDEKPMDKFLHILDVQV